MAYTCFWNTFSTLTEYWAIFVGDKNKKTQGHEKEMTCIGPCGTLCRVLDDEQDRRSPCNSRPQCKVRELLYCKYHAL